MSKVILGSIVFVGIIAGVAWWLLGRGSDAEVAPVGQEVSLQDSVQSVGESQEESAEEVSEGSVAQGGNDVTTQDVRRYVEYSPEALSDAQEKKRVLFFYADWCPFCREADAEFAKMTDKIPSDVVVIRVHYKDTETQSDEKALASTYGITTQHTFAQIDGEGKLVTKWVGGALDELVKNVE